MYKKIVTILLITAFGAARPEMGWSDGCRVAYQVKNAGDSYRTRHVFDLLPKAVDNPMFCIPTVNVFVLSLYRFPFSRTSLDNRIKHAAWYGQSNIFLADLVCNNAIFPVVDCAVGRVVNKSGIVTEKSSSYKEFVVDNGRLVVGAGITRAIKVSVTETTGVINTKNVKQFAGDVVMQVGSNALEEFVINPLSEELCGSNGAACQAVKCVGNGVAVYAMCGLVNYMVGK